MLELIAKYSLYVGFPDHLGLTWTNKGAISSAGAARWRLGMPNVASSSMADGRRQDMDVLEGNIPTDCVSLDSRCLHYPLSILGGGGYRSRELKQHAIIGNLEKRLLIPFEKVRKKL
jgi:hypothetical protein